MNYDNLGGLQSPDDPRDFKPEDLTGKASPTPASYVASVLAPVYEQKSKPACGGHGGTTFFQALAKNGETLSPRFVYAMCKKIDGVPDSQGTTGRAIMQVLQKYGVCSDVLFPNDTSLSYAEYIDTSKISPQAYADALTRRIGAYAKLPSTDLQTIKDNIFNNEAVLILGKLGNEWWTPSELAKDILPLRPPVNVISGHFWVDYAFSPTFINLRNSFGADWGANGNGYYGDNYTPFIVEAWVAQLPSPPPLPAPIPPSIKINNTQASNWLSQALQWVLNLINWNK